MEPIIHSGGNNLLDSIQPGPLPIGVASDESQVEKYGGYYIARYESSFDYNGGNPRVAIKPVDDASAATDFIWGDVVDGLYDGYLWSTVTAATAKEKSESMSSQCAYDSSVRTGLVTGAQCDTYLRLVHTKDGTYSLHYDGRAWGNHYDAEDL